MKTMTIIRIRYEGISRYNRLKIACLYLIAAITNWYIITEVDDEINKMMIEVASKKEECESEAT